MAKKPAQLDSPAAAAAAAESRRDALLDAAARDSPVLTLIAKRLRAAKKKSKRAEEIEALKAQGREINADQEEVLKGKTKNTATMEELEKLFPLLKEAVADELSQKLTIKAKQIEEAAVTAATEKAAEEAKATAQAHEVERAKAEAVAADLRTKIEAATQQAAAEELRRAEQAAADEARLAELRLAERRGVEEAVLRTLQLIYFSKLFSNEGRAENDFIHQMERDACLTYKSSTGYASDSLTQQDLDAICAFGKLVTTRSATEMVSHETALERCKALAIDWVNAAETTIPQLQTTVNDLVVRFERIVGSSYYSVKPEMRAPDVGSSGMRGEAAAAPAAAPPVRDGGAPVGFSAAGQYSSSQPSNNATLQQLLYQRPPHQVWGSMGFQLPAAMIRQTPIMQPPTEPHMLPSSPMARSQGSLEGQGSLDHGLPNGFVPSLSTGFSPPAHAGHQQGSAGFAPAFGAGTPQPPGFEPVGQQKGGHGSGAAGPQFLGAVFQGTTFGGITSADLVAKAPVTVPQTSNGTMSFYPATTEAAAPPLTDAASEPAKAPLDEIDGLVDRAPARKGSYAAPPGTRPRAPPTEPGRGRAPSRGRGQPRGEHSGRGGPAGRRGGPPPGRGYRGRGRDFQPGFGMQPVSSAGPY